MEDVTWSYQYVTKMMETKFDKQDFIILLTRIEKQGTDKALDVESKGEGQRRKFVQAAYSIS